MIWINIKERQPEKQGPLDFWVVPLGREKGFRVADGCILQIGNEEFWCNQYGKPFYPEGYTVTHWMYSPDPPEKEDSDEENKAS